MLKLGIDDAGRGPVIGPMVLAGVLIDSELEKELRKEGVKDSKLLKPEKREELAEIIRNKALSYKIMIVMPKEIDGSINDGVNLNRIEAIKAGNIIDKINKEVRDKIIVTVDCPSRNLVRWGKIMETHIENKENLDIKVEYEADLNHISVGAASILAKTTRDKEIKKIKSKIDQDIGSGYPSDPKTKKFLRTHVEKYPDEYIFRETWMTWQNAKKSKEQKSLGEY